MVNLTLGVAESNGHAACSSSPVIGQEDVFHPHKKHVIG